MRHPDQQKLSAKRRVLFVVESGTDVRMIEGLSEIAELTVLARRIERGREISQHTSAPFCRIIGPSSRIGFGKLVFRTLLESRHSYDICIVQGYGIAALAANCIGRLIRKPVLMLVCSPAEEYYLCRREADDPQAPFRKLEYRALKCLAKTNARVGGKYIVLSRYLESVVKSYKPDSSVRTIPLYGVDLEVFRPAAIPRPALRAQLKLPVNGSLIFASSRVAPEKDSRTLLQALSNLVKSGRNVWLLTLTGRREQFQRIADEFGMGERVIVADAVHPLHNLPDYYRAADLCVQVSRAEGLGFSPLEALACGTPVVATAVGGLRETIVDGVTGWMHEAGNAEQLSERIREILDDPEEGRRRAEAGRQMVMSAYEQGMVFQRLAECVDTLVAKS